MTRTPVRLAVLLTSLILSAPSGAQQGTPQQLPTIALNAGIHNIVAQLAQTAEQREIGLMFRREMPANDGMLFVFSDPGVQCFWMRNTLLPLSVAFVADDGSVVNVDDMKPMTETPHCSTKPVRFVLEMNLGWFEKRRVRSGSMLSGPPFHPAATR